MSSEDANPASENSQPAPGGSDAGEERRDPSETTSLGSDTVAAPDTVAPSSATLSNSETQAMQTPRLATLGNFVIEEKIGEGGMGVVYRAYDPDLHRAVAIKKIHPRFAGDEEYSQRFLTEAQSVAATIHPNIAQIFSIYPREAESLPYFAMEFVDGDSLEARVKDNGPLPVDEVLHIAVESSRGLRAAQQKGLIHRDIKPSNILMSRRREVKLVDFGLARRTEDIGSITQVGVVVGTPHFVSPEQGRGRLVDHRSDIYSLGCTLFFLLTGREPFDGDSKVDIILAHANDEVPSIQKLRPEVPRGVSALVERMLAKDPDDRFADYDELLQSLQDVIGNPDAAPPKTWVVHTALTLVAVLVGLGMSGIFAALQPDQYKPYDPVELYGDAYVNRDGQETLEFRFEEYDLAKWFPPRERPDMGHLGHPPIDTGQALTWRSYSEPVAIPCYLQDLEELELHGIRFDGDPDFRMVLGYDASVPQNCLRISFPLGVKNDGRVVEYYRNGELVDLAIPTQRRDFTLECGVDYTIRFTRLGANPNGTEFQLVIEQMIEGRPVPRVEIPMTLPESGLPRGGIALRGDGFRRTTWSISVREVMVRGRLDHPRIERELDPSIRAKRL